MSNVIIKADDIDKTTIQTVNNLTCFAICIAICAVALLAQFYNVYLVFYRSAGKSRRIFFYLLLPSAILCSLIYVVACAQLTLGYVTGHSYAWIKDITTHHDTYPEHKAFWKPYIALQYTLNLSYSIFTVLYILCIQLRFRAIHAIYRYPKWIDHGLFIFTICFWFTADFLFGVIFYSSEPNLGNIMAASWTIYVLLADNVLSGIFLWRLWKIQNDIRTFSSRRGKISRSIIRGMIGMCVTLWITLIIFEINPIVFHENKQQNLTVIVECFAMAAFPIYFFLGFAWMEAVLQLYSPRSKSKSIIFPNDTKNVTLSMKVKAASPCATIPNSDGWASIINDEGDCPYDGSGYMIEMEDISNIGGGAQNRVDDP